MAVVEDDVYTSDSYLFEAEVKDAAGVDQTPTAVTMDIYDEDGTLIVNAQPGVSALGKATYDWSGSATAGRFKAYLRTTVGTTIKTSTWVISVLAKDGS